MPLIDLTLGVVQHLGSRNGVQDLVLEERQPAARHELFIWEQRTHCTLPDDMRWFYLASNGFNLTWTAKFDTSVIPVGKMWLNKIQNVTRLGGILGNQPGPSLTDVESDSNSENEDDTADILERRYRAMPSFNTDKCHLFELDPCDGLGKVCLVYHQPETNIKPDIWFLDRSLRWHYLAESFSAYYRLMLMNLGLPQWQYTFTDVGLSSQAKQWFHIYAVVRLELNHDLLSSASTSSNEPKDTEPNKLDPERLFQLNRGNKKKVVSSASSTTLSSAVSQPSSQLNTTSSLAKKKPSTVAPKNASMTAKFMGSNVYPSSRPPQK